MCTSFKITLSRWKFQMHRSVTKAIFPVAKMGTRFLPMTKSILK